MNILDIIDKKKSGKELLKEEIDFFINGYVKDEITDYQAAALIMAIFLNGMTKEETTNLTIAMAKSGDVLDLSKIGKIIVDKHSTGGVGDKVSMILLPIVSSLGVPVAKMSGRGLGFTGGTVDKLESIPGYRTNIEMNEFVDNVKKIGISMIAQTLNLAPADKKIYSLRDSISCVESIPLIASSIMSKKIASGADKIVLDVTVGKGAFMQSLEKARELSNEMIEIGKIANRETICVLTSMDEPLGIAVGNNLEVIEAINFLKGIQMEEDVKDVVFELGAYMIKLSGLGDDLEDNKERMYNNIINGKAFEKFLELVKNQGGDISYIEDVEKFEKSRFIEPVYLGKDGYITQINAKEIGIVARDIGAGRIKKEDDIDESVGIIFNKKVGDFINKEEPICYLHINNENIIESTQERIKNIVLVENTKPEKTNTIIEIIK